MSYILELARIAEEEFPDIIEQRLKRDRLRSHIADGSLLNAWLSRRIP